MANKADKELDGLRKWLKEKYFLDYDRPDVTEVTRQIWRERYEDYLREQK